MKVILNSFPHIQMSNGGTMCSIKQMDFYTENMYMTSFYTMGQPAADDFINRKDLSRV
jgi:hypothetical protein